MTKHLTEHAGFTIERVLDAPPATVFRAFAEAEAKARWFGGAHGRWREEQRRFDFQVGGHERLIGVWENGTVSRFDALYHDIVPGERIVYSYTMHIDEAKISVSLATIELTAEGAGTRLKITEQGAFLDGYDDAGSRERGTAALMDAMAASLQSVA